MTRRTQPTHLRNLLLALDDEEKRILRESMGIDVHAWHLDEAAFANYRKIVDDYRAAMAAELEARSGMRDFGETQKCSGCGRFGKEQVELFLTLAHGTTICDKCFGLLERYARNGTQ